MWPIFKDTRIKAYIHHANHINSAWLKDCGRKSFFRKRSFKSQRNKNIKINIIRGHKSPVNMSHSTTYPVSDIFHCWLTDYESHKKEITWKYFFSIQIHDVMLYAYRIKTASHSEYTYIQSSRTLQAIIVIITNNRR